MSDKNPLAHAMIIGQDVDPKVYLRNEKRGTPEFTMSRSDLAEMSHCPARWIAGYKKKDTEEMDFGSMVDTLLLQPKAWDERYVTPPETYPAAKGEAKPWNNNAMYCRDWNEAAEKAGKIPVKQKDKDRVRHAVGQLLYTEEVKALVNQSTHQVFVGAMFHDEITGLNVPVKVLIDMVPMLSSPWPKCLADLKTVYTCDARLYAKSVFEYQLHWQAAMCLDAYSAATGEDRNTFLHVAIENYEPFYVAQRILSQEFTDLGRTQYVEALRKYCACLKTGIWPGYYVRENIGNWGKVDPMPYMIGE